MRNTTSKIHKRSWGTVAIFVFVVSMGAIWSFNNVSAQTGTATSASTTEPVSWIKKDKVVASPNIAFSYTVTLENSKDCTGLSPKTAVTAMSTAPTASTFQLSKDQGATYATYPWGKISLSNGLYYWRVKFESGYIINQPLRGSFALNKQCGSRADAAESEVDLSEKRLEYYRSLFGKIEYQEASQLSQEEKDSILARVKVPAQCMNELECQVYCGQESVIATNLCTAYIHADVSNSGANIFEERTGARAFIDSDSDGISDYDELHIYHTDPSRADSDKDGYLDGVEVSFRTDPAQFDSASSVPQELLPQNDPLLAGVSEPNLLSIKDVTVTKIATSTEGRAEAGEITFRGHALPNGFVTIYIFSNPIIVTIKADASGEWTYTLDKELPDGTHQVVSAITDNTGRVLAKSDPLPFVKVAEALTFGNIETALPEEQKLGFFSGQSLYVLITIIIGVFFVGLSAIGIMTRRRAKVSDTMTS